MIRENAGHNCAFTRRGLDLHFATMQFHEGAHNGEAEANTAMTRTHCMRVEAIKDAIQNFERNATALIRDFEDNFTRSAQGRHGDGLSGLRKTNRIGEQIEEHLANAFAICTESANVIKRHDMQTNA